MTEQKQKVEKTWLQCEIPKDMWQQINERRLKLGLKWGVLLLAATLSYLDHAEQLAEQPEQPGVQKKAKAKRLNKRR